MPLVVHVANLVLEETIERIYSKDHYADKYVGLYLIRGENVVLLGEIVRLPRLSLRTGTERVGYVCLRRT